ncbi:hypothetical protein MKX01_014129 [Papaver californicum]|nr:hypothetical protein MKX01_014129 [Papaver californicum]
MGSSTGFIRGVLLDESLLFAEDNSGNTFFQSGSESILSRLQYSNLHMGIPFEASVSPQKVIFLKEMAMLYSLDCFMLDAFLLDSSLSEILQAWGDIRGSCLYVASSKDEDLFLKPHDHGWLTVAKCKDSGDRMEDSEVMLINKLEELPLTLYRLSRKVSESYSSSSSTSMTLSYVPSIITQYMYEVDHFVLICWFFFHMYCENHPDCCVIDPLDKIYPVVDRLMIQKILAGLEELKTGGDCRIRAPHLLKKISETNMMEWLSEDELLLPSIVKPQVACGVADVHNMQNSIIYHTDSAFFKGGDGWNRCYSQKKLDAVKPIQFSYKALDSDNGSSAQSLSEEEINAFPVHKYKDAGPQRKVTSLMTFTIVA